ncbi:ATP-binding protein [Pseudomonas aeruginosa]|nr:transporter substrate-binding domain-containing protein [Pseudomonas aeruginosa]HCK4901720.1 transporter substrate-binding domain-containing protein [Pseudomonas aeruginosa]
MTTNTRPWLNVKDWQWLIATKLKVGIISPDHPPISIIQNNRYQGIAADYLSLLLPSPPEVKKFYSRKAALRALQNGEIDILENGNMIEAQERGAFFSTPYLRQQSVLVQTVSDPFNPKKSENILALAIEGTTTNEAKKHYPYVLKTYRSPLSALEALALGDVDGALMEVSSAHYLIQTRYLLDLQIENFSNLNASSFRFLFSPYQERLKALINQGLPIVERKYGETIRKNWSAGQHLNFENPKISLTATEKKWIKENPTITAVAILSLGPLTQLDSNGEIAGIAQDYLKIISQRSGLKINYIQAKNIAEAKKLLHDKKALITPYLPPEEVSSTELDTLPAYLHTSTVLMALDKGKNKHERLNGLKNLEGKKLAITEGYFLKERIERKYPEIKITTYQSTIEAMQSVEQGSNDAMLTNNFIGPYLSMQYFGNNIKVAEILSDHPIPLGIGVVKNQPSLKNILIKSQLTITPEEVSQIIQRWRPNFAEGKKSFWQDHNEIILKSILSFASLTSICLIWLFYLSRQIKRTRLAEKKADAANQAKSHFITTLNHEIRNPLNAIIGLQEIALEKSKKGQNTTKILETANEAAQNILLLLSNVLDLSRIESGKLEPTLQTANLKEVIEKSIHISKALAKQKKLDFNTFINKNTNHFVYINLTSLNQIISNLASNAIKFTNTGEIKVEAHTIAHKEIDKLWLILRITDSGVGIKAEDQKKLFQPFSQVGERTEAHSSGSGLGLSITQNLISLMNGHLILHSKEGEGSCFTVKIPLSLATEISPPLKNISDPVKSLDSLSVLVAEDHPFNRLALSMQLESLGHKVKTASNGEDAWKLWKARHFDLIITDKNMPISSGLDLINRIRKEENTNRASCKIIILTASAEKNSDDALLSKGADAILYKPTTTEQLRSTISKVTKKT